MRAAAPFLAWLHEPGLDHKQNEMTIRNAYAAAVQEHGLAADEAQARVVSKLARLQQRLTAKPTLGARIRRLLPGENASSGPRGMYLWGGVGRGKTFLMDLFYTSLAVEKKRRIHFHRMMRDVHARLNRLQNTENPLDAVAADIADETRVLCFDEFFVSDIADAMILGQLLHGLFRRGVTLVATSNSHPRDLYKDGLQRQQFLPAITALETYTEIVELRGETDYRLQLLETAGTYFVNDSSAAVKLGHYFAEIASGETSRGEPVTVLGRDIPTHRAAKGIVWFDFFAICDGPRSQEDYIEIARWYPSVIISGVPVLTAEKDDAARRFIALVDEFYDRRVKLLVAATAPPASLYQGSRLAFEFERTASRLAEMQTREYLHAEHLA